MPTVEIEGRSFEVDEDGFLKDPTLWDNDVARLFARLDDVEELTADHWKIIRCIRSHYQRHGMAPMVRKVCQETGLRLRDIYRLFPLGPAKGACKVAGLPKPDGCV